MLYWYLAEIIKRPNLTKRTLLKSPTEDFAIKTNVSYNTMSHEDNLSISYKYEMRRKKRGGHCIFGYTDPITNVGKSCRCGCGSRSQPSKKHKQELLKGSCRNI